MAQWRPGAIKRRQAFNEGELLSCLGCPLCRVGEFDSGRALWLLGWLFAQGGGAGRPAEDQALLLSGSRVLMLLCMVWGLFGARADGASHR